MKTKLPEIILPGGDLERVKVAIDYGADAVYLGLDKHSLRKTEIRFDIQKIKQAIEYAHERGKRIFVTFNIFAHNQQLSDIEKDLDEVAKLNPDAFIISDPGIINIAKKVASDVPIHLSTQANTTNYESVKFWYKQGVKRIVLARELSLEEIRQIHEKVPEMELEVFVHGSMCISYSGRCLLSGYMTGRNANLGECAQPCRWNYNLYAEEKLRPGELFPIKENENGTSIFSSKDLRLIRYLPELVEAGVTGLKIEGRNKSEFYVATAAHAYRNALDLIEKNNYTNKQKDIFEEELEKLNYRDYTTGFIFGDALKGQTYPYRVPIRKWNYLGKIIEIIRLEKNKHLYSISVNNKICKNDEIEILTPERIYLDKVTKIFDMNNNELYEVNPGKTDQKAIIELSKELPAGSFLRKNI
jgi:putative protease